MKTLICCYVLLVLGFTATQATAAEWQTDYDKALAKAKAENRPVLVSFTGSDWCGPCIAMDKQVFSQREFLDYADKHLVLLEIDYPKTKPLSDELKKQNERLKYQFKINKRGYPTIALVDSAGQVLGISTGYDDEKPADIIARIEMWVKHPTSDTAK
jgi:thioredoxin-related protein